MRNQWIEAGSAFGLEYSGNCLPIRCIAAQTVNCLGRERDKLSVAQQNRSTRQAGFV